MGSIIAIANAITTTILSGGGSFVPPTPPADGIITETSRGDRRIFRTRIKWQI